MPGAFRKVVKYDDIDIKIQIGNYLVNVVYLRTISDKAIGPIPRHSHSSYELHLQTKGTGYIVTDHGTSSIGPGSVYVTGPNVFHSQHFDEDSVMEEYSVNFEFIRNKSDRQHMIHCDDADAVIHNFVSKTFWIGQDNGTLTEYFTRLFTELTHPSIGAYENIKALLTMIITCCSRYYSCDYKNIEFPQKNLDDKRRLIIESYFIRIKEDMNPEELSERLCISVRQLDRIIKQYYGQSFKDKLTQAKIEASLTYLANEAFTISTVSDIMGFTNESYYCKVFKKHFACTPTEYRQRNKSPGQHP